MNKIADQIDHFVYSLTRRWVLYLTILLTLYVGLPFLAPVLLKFGAERPAQAIYTMYRPLCHTFAYRSWFLFGEKSNYPANEFKNYTGLDPYTNEGRWKARQFVGNPEMGYKVGYCQRDIAIYGTLLIFTILYGLLTRMGVTIKPLPIWLYLLVGILPIGLDGFSQLLSQPPFTNILTFVGTRESTPLLRSLTGSLFGLANGWLALPYVAESMVEIRADIEAKFSKQKALARKQAQK